MADSIRAAVPLADTSDLTEVIDGAPPFVTVHLALDTGIEDAPHRNELRWRTQRAELEEAGAPASALVAIDALVVDAHQAGKTLFTVADADSLRHVSFWPELPLAELAVVAPLPVLTPLVDWRQSLPPHVLVAIDRTGADVIGVRWDRRERAETVAGEDASITKSHPGGWSQQRYQARAENTWERNAGDVADAVARMARDVDAQFIAVGGDVRARGLLSEALPAELRELVRDATGTRADDGSPPDDLAEARADVVNRVHAALLDRVDDGMANGVAARGLARTLEALAMGRVDVLLVHDDLTDERTAWFGPEPTQVGRTADDLRALGVDDPVEARAVDVAVRAALATSAGVRVLPSPDRLPDGFGALLRW
jgi:hypothetical protein